MPENEISYTKPMPKKRPIDEPYWEGARAGELRLPRCSNCGTWRFPPEEFCPKCLSRDFTWSVASGNGTIWGRIFMHQQYYASFADEIPYNIVWVELDEGPMMTANVVGAANDEIEVGARVSAVFDAVTPELTIPRFQLATN